MASKKKKKRPSLRLLKQRLWKECQRITREKYGNTCYTCGVRNLEGGNWQTGHGKPKGALPLRYQYDIRNLRPQCMRCNVHLQGMTDIFIMKMEREEEGLQFLNDACRLSKEGVWEIRRDVPLLHGIEAEFFIENLIKLYRAYEPNSKVPLKGRTS